MADRPTLTTSAGAPIGDNQNSLTAGARGPVLLQDYQLLEKLAHQNRERIPERVVHAKGWGRSEPLPSLTTSRSTRMPGSSRKWARRPRCWRASPPSRANKGLRMRSAMSADSPSNSTQRMETGIWSATTRQFFLCVTPISSLISFIPKSAIRAPTCAARQPCGISGRRRPRAFTRSRS